MILSGIFLNVLAAALGYFLIQNQLKSIAEENERIRGIELRINSLWNQHVEAERKRELLVLLPTDEQGNLLSLAGYRLLTGYLDKNTEHRQKDDLSIRSPEALQDVITQHQRALLEKIDSLYLDQVTESQAVTKSEQKLERYRGLTLFLQLMGLILVASKDLPKYRV